jgi:hypothetical protein
MTEPVAPVADTQSLADYVRVENAKEQALEAGEAAPVESAPTEGAVAATKGTLAAEAPVDMPSQEPTEPVEAERNADGTFKPKSEKVTAKGEWKRNQELTARLRESERQLEEARASVPRATPAPAAITDPSDPEPTLDMFLEAPDPYAKLALEAGKWAVRDDRRQQQRQEASSAVLGRVEAFMEDHPDYPDKLATVNDVIFPNEVLQSLADDDLGPAVAYHLASHPEEARRIAALRPLEGVKAIGKLLSRFETAPSGSVNEAPRTSKAQPLIKPVSAAPIAPESASPDDLPFGPEYIRRMNQQERQRRREMSGA